MEDRKTTLDRGQISSEYIQGKQDFNHVLKVHRAMKPPLWKTAWFYGPVGLAIVAITLSAVKFNPQQTKNTTYGSNITLEQKKTEKPPVKTIIAAVSEVSASTYENQDKKEKPQVITKAVVSTKAVEKPKEVGSKKVEEVKEAVVIPEVKAPIPVTHVVQPNEVVKKISTRNMMPAIDGVFMGNITSNQLCSREGIWINEDWLVTNFTIQYNNGVEDIVQKINGAAIPESICWKIHRFNLNFPVFITEIVAVDPTGARKSVPSMSLTPVY